MENIQPIFYIDRNENEIEYTEIVCSNCGSKSDQMEKEIDALWCGCGERYYKNTWSTYAELQAKYPDKFKSICDKCINWNDPCIEKKSNDLCISYATEEDLKPLVEDIKFLNKEEKIKEFKSHAMHYPHHYSETLKDPYGKKIGTKSITKILTDKGLIDEELWYKQALEIIIKYNELPVLEALKQYIKDTDYGAIKNYCDNESYDLKIEQHALDRHMRRHFESASSEYYIEFRNRYKKILEQI